MDEETLKAIANQLRQPSGEYAIEVAKKMNEGNRQINLHTIEALQLAAGDNILEIGMGNGFFVKDILSIDDTIKYSGCDFSQAMVDEASRHNKDFIETRRAQFYFASATRLPFEEETFNKVFSVNTLYFWDNPKLILTEISRVLKPEGLIVISIRPKVIMQDYPFVKFGFEMYEKEQLMDLLTQNNFKVTSAIEKEEPNQEIDGQMMKVATLIVCAEKK
ncbi:class I SAM-dependent methyltransferase [Reichenbachiella sp. MALMAid0571]|uniref:class I SAM-dependent methyltransferase n=1 Tax=Reichenbachiella sp. MALMAid0571 TaxID=3143939 RepID=UPI0032DF49E2